MNSPPISVVMSVFNGQAFLAEAIESVLGQTFRDFELLIIDDGSTDGTAEILSAFAQRDRRIRIVSHPNKGRAQSLNIGINLAAGKYIARMDADDVALATRFEEQVEFMNEHPDIVVLGGAVELIDTKGQVLHTVRRPLEDAEIRVAMLSYSPLYHPAVMMRKEAVVAVGGYREALLDADDYDLWLRIAEFGRMANLDRVILRYRVHADQVSLRGMKQQMLCVLAARASASLRRHGLPDPLSNVAAVTPEVLSALGVRDADIQSGILRSYCDWIEVVGRCNPEAAVQITEEFLQMADHRYIPRAILANALMTGAFMQWKQGRRSASLLSVARAVLARPIIAGRPLKRVFMQVVVALKGELRG